MTDAQHKFLTGGANSVLVTALLVLGGGYGGYQTVRVNAMNAMTTDMAARLSADRNRYEDTLDKKNDELNTARNRYEDLMQRCGFLGGKQ